MEKESRIVFCNRFPEFACLVLNISSDGTIYLELYFQTVIVFLGCFSFLI